MLLTKIAGANFFLPLHAKFSTHMHIEQFEDKSLAHYSYAILSEGEIALIDPERDPKKYFDFAQQNNARIVAVIETHPHADFISSHLEIHKKTGATIYVSQLLSADYPHKTFDEGETISIGKIKLLSLNTPGHSPDSISIVAIDENGKPGTVFTGDTLFIGDCGRPDLRERAGALTEKREELARHMYHSLRAKLMTLPDDVKVYPSHGAGSLCGKGLSSQNVSTIGAEKATNWCLQEFSEAEFVKELLSNQPFVPKYFAHSVALNKQGAPNFEESVDQVSIGEWQPSARDNNIVIIDTRNESEFKKGFRPNSINLMDGGKFETWLGSIISPGEKFYLIVESEEKANELVRRIAKIGYESQIASVFIASELDGNNLESLDLANFKKNPDYFTVVDIRNQSEVNDGKIFENALVIPLPELRERVDEIPIDKPIVVHCAAGYRSAAGTSIIKNKVSGSTKVFDLGEAINDFKK